MKCSSFWKRAVTEIDKLRHRRIQSMHSGAALLESFFHCQLGKSILQCGHLRNQTLSRQPRRCTKAPNLRSGKAEMPLWIGVFPGKGACGSELTQDKPVQVRRAVLKIKSNRVAYAGCSVETDVHRLLVESVQRNG